MSGFRPIAGLPIAGQPAAAPGGSPYTLTITSAAVTLTGTSVNLKRALQLSVSTAAITLTGTSVFVRRAYTITVGTRALSLSGTSVTLRAARRIAITSAAVTLTGTSVNLRVARRIAVTSAAVTLSGTSVNLRSSRQLSITSAAVTLTGSSVNLTYTPVSAAKVLTIISGSIVLSGSAVDLNYAPVANQNVPPPQRYGSGQYGEPAKLILSWMPPKKRKKDEKARIEIVEDAIGQALEAAPVASPINSEQVELAAKLLLAEYSLAELRRIKYAETLLLRIEQVMAEMDDEEVLLLAA
jgi:hypothetical protein